MICSSTTTITTWDPKFGDRRSTCQRHSIVSVKPTFFMDELPTKYYDYYFYYYYDDDDDDDDNY